MIRRVCRIATPRSLTQAVFRGGHRTALWADYRAVPPRWTVTSAAAGLLIAVAPPGILRLPSARRWVSGTLAAPLMVTGSVALIARRFRGQMRQAAIDAVSWRGDEWVLDIGCGSGMMLNGLARKLSTGRAVGIDVWAEASGSGDLAMLMRNAEAEGVADRIEFHEVDARAMEFDDGTFDVVMASWSLHHMPDGHDGFHAALGEILRVLEPHGTIVVLDVAAMVAALADGLANLGFATRIEPQPLGQALLIARGTTGAPGA